jgi:hypothetical protein
LNAPSRRSAHPFTGAGRRKDAKRGNGPRKGKVLCEWQVEGVRHKKGLSEWLNYPGCLTGEYGGFDSSAIAFGSRRRAVVSL